MVKKKKIFFETSHIRNIFNLLQFLPLFLFHFFIFIICYSCLFFVSNKYYTPARPGSETGTPRTPVKHIIDAPQQRHLFGRHQKFNIKKKQE